VMHVTNFTIPATCLCTAAALVAEKNPWDWILHGVTPGFSGPGNDTPEQDQSGKSQNEQGSSHVSLLCRTLPMLSIGPGSGRICERLHN